METIPAFISFSNIMVLGFVWVVQALLKNKGILKILRNIRFKNEKAPGKIYKLSLYVVPAQECTYINNFVSQSLSFRLLINWEYYL